MNGEKKTILEILIPTFNGEEHLPETLDALIEQIVQVDEAIVISIYDNASTDNTEKLVRNYIEKNYFINYTRHENNNGPDFNYLYAATKCEAQFAWLFSDDDVILPGAIVVLIEKIKSLTNKTGALLLNCEVLLFKMRTCIFCFARLHFFRCEIAFSPRLMAYKGFFSFSLRQRLAFASLRCRMRFCTRHSAIAGSTLKYHFSSVIPSLFNFAIKSTVLFSAAASFSD